MSDIQTEPVSTADRELVITRTFDAPRELVFAAWTDPEHIAEWWGPKGFTTTLHEMDVRPGGEWNFVMHGPNGVDYRNEIRYEEVSRPERLVYMHGPSPRFHVTVTFEDLGGMTGLTMRTVFETAEERDRVVRVYGAIEGGHQTLGKLAEYLARA